jgi:hypothetical protein
MLALSHSLSSLAAARQYKPRTEYVQLRTHFSASGESLYHRRQAYKVNAAICPTAEHEPCLRS